MIRITIELGLACCICRYATYLHAPLAALAADKDADIRCQLASCFCLLPSMLGRERCLQHLKRYSAVDGATYLHTAVCLAQSLARSISHTHQHDALQSAPCAEGIPCSPFLYERMLNKLI